MSTVRAGVTPPSDVNSDRNVGRGSAYEEEAAALMATQRPAEGGESDVPDRGRDIRDY
jgi:hypothetical protein